MKVNEIGIRPSLGGVICRDALSAVDAMFHLGGPNLGIASPTEGLTCVAAFTSDLASPVAGGKLYKVSHFLVCSVCTERSKVVRT